MSVIDHSLTDSSEFLAQMGVAMLLGVSFGPPMLPFNDVLAEYRFLEDDARKPQPGPSIRTIFRSSIANRRPDPARKPGRQSKYR